MIEIRRGSEADAAAVRDIYAPYVTSSIVSFETEVPAVEEMARRVERAHSWLVAVDGDGVAGYAYAGTFNQRPAYRWSAEVSIYLAESRRGKGLGLTLMTALLDELTERGFVNAFAGVTLPNDASVRLFESLGFERIALQRDVGFKLGAWHDVGWWQKRLREPPIPPTEPKSVAPPR